MGAPVGNGMPSPVHIRVTQSFAQAPKVAYEWLTDFDEGDVERAGAVIEKRKVLERAGDRIVYEGETEVIGRRIWGVTEVTLQRPDRWSARVTQGPRTGTVVHYHLVPKREGCTLTIDYHFIVAPPTRHLLLRVVKPLVAGELRKMWAGFRAAMDREMSA